MRIFLSYGHDKFSSLAERLKADLERLRHGVWFDRSRLKGGVEWERYIEEGLDWVSAKPDLGRFLLLMTPHSVGRPSGFCLNELTRAIARGLPIVPIMVSDVEPPLSIARLQWVDMRECFPPESHEEKYKVLFQELLDAIEHHQIPFQGVQARLIAELRPLQWNAESARHLVRFTGREWVMREVNDWLKSPRRVLWVTGDPGVGKSALAAWLCERRPEIVGVHYCEYGNTDRVDPVRTLRSLAYQLCRRVPAYEERVNASLADVIGRSGASATFDSLFVGCAHDLPEPRMPLVMVIDGLDEATSDRGNELAYIIGTRFDRAPEWLRLIVLTRPNEPEINYAFQTIDPWKIEAKRTENLDDISEYLRRELPAATGIKRLPHGIIETIVSKSEGLFLYAKWVRDDLENGNLSLDRLDRFPRGLGGIYLTFFERTFAKDEYKQKWRPLLEAICAARQPLSIEDLKVLFGWNAYDLKDATDRLRSLFPLTGERVRPFHPSVRDWLTEVKSSGPYWIDLPEGHRRLAESGWRQYKSDIETMNGYFVVHLPAHLAAAEKREKLAELLLDFDWMQRKLNATNATDLIADYGLLDSSAIGSRSSILGRAIGVPPWRAT